MFKCVECGYEYDPNENENCPLCCGGRDMEESYTDTFTFGRVVMCSVCNTAFNSLIGMKVCPTCRELDGGEDGPVEDL